MATINFDNTMKGLAAKIVPFKAVFNDTVDVSHLTIMITNDNQKDNCSLWWEVIDEKQVKHVSGILVLNGEDYIKNNVSREKRFEYVANALGLTFV